MELFSPGHLIPLLIVIAILFFGWKQLPDMARSVGRSLRIFKTEMKGMGEDDAAREGRDAVPPAVTSTPAMTQPAAPAMTQPGTVPQPGTVSQPAGPPMTQPAAPVPAATVPVPPATVPSAQVRNELDPTSNASVENHKPATG